MKYAGKEPYPLRYGDNSTGQCSDCGENFFGQAAFDKHRRDDGDDRVCIDLVESGLWRLDERGRWHYGRPMTAEERARVSGAS